jgi:hypothetical protein
MVRSSDRWPVASAGAFPRAAAYRALFAEGPGGLVREDGPGWLGGPDSERRVQCVWFDPQWRPPELATHDGERVEVENPGAWNLEDGPDFLGAALRIGPHRRRIEGDVEIHLRASDWTAHGHAADPRYARVRAHVTYAPGVLPAAALPAGAVQIALRDALRARATFSFDAVDPTLYPYGSAGEPAPCATVLADWSPDEREAFLRAAGEERLRRRAAAFAFAARERGWRRVFYEECFAALGYKHNKVPFRRLAERVGPEALAEESGGDPDTAYALLLGVAGLLPRDVRKEWDAETRRFVRRLWDAWWRREDAWSAQVLPAGGWRLAGVRPPNHPARRLMAAARLFAGGAPLLDELRELAARDPAGFPRRALARLDAGEPTYWDRRLSWSGPAAPAAAALIGPSRGAALLVNVVVPILAAAGGAATPVAGLLDALPAEADNAHIRSTARALFGPGWPPSLARSAIRRQGLLQIFHDFCLNRRARCARCRLPAWLERRR